MNFIFVLIQYAIPTGFAFRFVFILFTDMSSLTGFALVLCCF